MNDPLTSFTNVANSLVGVSMLVMPYCIKQCGIFLGVAAIVVTAWVSIISCRILLKCLVRKQSPSFEELGTV